MSEDPSAPVNKWAAVAVLLLANFMNLIDITIVNVAMPSLQSELDAAPNLVEWIVAGYTFSFALLLLPAGRMGDLFGRRRMFLTGIAIFTLASLACGLAPGIDTLVAARVAQGVGAAIMTPQTLALVPTLFPREQRGAAFGLFALTAGLASVTGPILGGLLIGADIYGLTWRPIFLVNIPVGVGAFVAACFLVPRADGDRALGIDVVGMILAALAMLAVLVPLVEAPSIGWRTWMWPLVLAAGPLAWSFVAWQRRQAARGAPELLPLRLARSGGFLTGGLLNAVLFSAVPSYFLTIALYLQSGYGLTALQSGLATTPFPIGVLIASAMTGWFGSRWIARRVVGGALLLGLGFAGQAWAIAGMDGEIVWLRMAPWFLLGGIGLGNTVSPLYQVALSAADDNDTGSASGAVQAIRQVGIAFGVAIMGGIFFGLLGGAETGDREAYRLAMLGAIGYAGLVSAILILAPFFTPMRLADES
ncbi:EmrB/QacA subfamily drug resistance transporter [Palleronia aestuarii]|uniref:EmrB/QacA subfamily drug resistance transporter n=1 Tax=Palleronia aestuarii TaxID=568105 RepID=A0A2W7N9G1_9RHOB|nr:MFS transporter [Palleronia aestuarii]PZX17045.1 EmrB/QacA subfamily drug resistance transporter [Palleronia aestuarii]